MLRLYILFALLPIAYVVALLLEYLCDRLLLKKQKELAEWDCVYDKPLCSRFLLWMLAYACLGAGYLLPATLKGQLLSTLLLLQLLVVCLIDYKFQFIFDEQNLVLLLTGLLRIQDYPTFWKEPIVACVGAFFVMFLLAVISRGAMGGGDIKLMSALGLWLGVWGIMNAFFYGVLAGGIGALILLLLRKKGAKDYFAFGPYLCLGAIYAWYMQCASW